VRAKVQTSRDNPRPVVVDDEWQRLRAAKLAQLKAAQQVRVALRGASIDGLNTVWIAVRSSMDCAGERKARITPRIR
jgi:hypothetical protein